MKMRSLMKCEFIKNYTIVKVLFVLVVLLLSAIIFSESSTSIIKTTPFDIQESIDDSERYYQELLKIDTPNTRKKEFMMNQELKRKENLELLQKLDETMYTSYWQYEVLTNIQLLENKLFVIHQMIAEPTADFTVSKKEDSTMVDSYEEAILSINRNESLIKQKEETEEEIKNWKTILQSNKLYLYLEYRLNKFKILGMDDPNFFSSMMSTKYHITEENKELYEFLVEEKVETEKDLRVLNFIQLSREEEEQPILDLEEYDSTDYEGYVRYQTASNQIIKKNREIIHYGLIHNKKTDLAKHFNVDGPWEGYYKNTQIAVNQVFHFPIIVLILVIVTSAGVISGEHSAKTEKALLTSPMKRGKVLFTKFLYLISQTYIIWLMGFLFLIIYSGIRFGFGDLFTSKLVYDGNSVHEVNYLLYTLGKLFINSIPVLAMVTIVFALSVITLSTSLTVGITLIPTLLSLALWQLISQFSLYFLLNTPFPYFNLTLMEEGNNFYLATLYSVDIGKWQFLKVSIITILLCYFLAHFVFVKRDVKN